MAECFIRLYSCAIRTNNGLLNLNSKLIYVRQNSAVAHKLIYSECGDPPKVVRMEKFNLPTPKSNQIMIKMIAAPVNPADINTIQGVYAVKPQLPSIPGNEGVAEVMSFGSEVKELQEGDRVVPRHNAFGTWCTHSVCEPSAVMKVSPDLGIVEAATLTVNPCTAYRMLKDFVKLKQGDAIIQNGANSAAGQAVIQLCKAWGLNSVNIVRNRSTIEQLKTFLKNLGATHVITEEELSSTDIFKSGSLPKPKLALNCVGGKNALNMMRQLDHGGIMVTYGGMSREPVTVPTSALIFKDFKVCGFWMTRWSQEHAATPERAAMLEELATLYINGQLKPPTHRMIPFSQYKEALESTMNPKGFTGAKYILDCQKIE